MMKNGYERASKEIVPAARIALARELKSRYNMTESNIAQVLGVAQAAVSDYLNGNYSKVVENAVEKVDVDSIDKYIVQISKGNKVKLKQCVCTICSGINGFNCRFSAIKQISGNR